MGPKTRTGTWETGTGDNATHQINLYPVDNTIRFSPILIHWIVIYPLESAIRRLNITEQWADPDLQIRGGPVIQNMR